VELGIGSVVDRYLVEGFLGEGGMAMVYRVRHRDLGSQHALKVLSVQTRTIRERLLREGRMQSGLRHPNIVPVTDVVQVAQSPALVMDYIAGPDLAELIFRCSLSDAQADQLIRGILRGVAAAHAIGLVHRDLKPSNILVDIQGRAMVPRVTDFGLAKPGPGTKDSALTRTGTAMGTPGYMAPEQIRDSSAVDARADVFSLGAILYELLARRRAFDGTDIMDIWNRVSAGNYTPLGELRPGLTTGLCQLIHSALERSRESSLGRIGPARALGSRGRVPGRRDR
jgi:serine/threonine protein kinase